MIELWAGVQLKLNHAAFHLEKMERALDPPERTHMNVALEAAGALLGTSWERPFYAHVDAFLSATRSIPEVIQSCFGEDKGAPTAVKQWFAALPAAEQNKRQQFTAQFKPHYDAFRALPLGTERHKTEHRIGYPGVTVTMMGRFGATYVGSPVQSVPTSETRNIEAG